jgi:hypothetical protein
MAASVIVSFDVMRAGCASATAASSIHQPSVDCSVLGHPPRSLIGPRVSRILVVLQITLQTTPRATAALLPPAVPLARIVPFDALSNNWSWEKHFNPEKNNYNNKV